VSLTLRAWSRYVVPLTVLSVIAFVPLLWIASRVGLAADLPRARAQVRIGWALAAVAWCCQLWLVAGVAPAVRSVGRGEPISQLRAFSDGLRGLARGLLPCLIAIVGVGLGGLALVVPGVLLLVLFALTGASDRLGEPPAVALADSVAVVRANLTRVALIVAAIIVVNLAITFVLQWQLVPFITKKVAAAKLAPIRTFVRTVPLALAVLSPVAACALAAAYTRLKSRTS
jgi:hypothetical protein